jgi:hypothetical protein
MKNLDFLVFRLSNFRIYKIELVVLKKYKNHTQTYMKMFDEKKEVLANWRSALSSCHTETG